MADGSIGSRALTALAGAPAVTGLCTASLLLRRTTALLLRRHLE
jgi:hypothetical protein